LELFLNSQRVPYSQQVEKSSLDKLQLIEKARSRKSKKPFFFKNHHQLYRNLIISLNPWFQIVDHKLLKKFSSSLAPSLFFLYPGSSLVSACDFPSGFTIKNPRQIEHWDSSKIPKAIQSSFLGKVANFAPLIDSLRSFWI